MRIDVQARGFSLTHALQEAVEAEVFHCEARCPDVLAGVRVRLFDTNGPRGGNDKVCLIQASLRGRRESVVASHVDADLYRAIAGAFAKVGRGTRSVLGRSVRRRGSDAWLDAVGP